MTQLDIITGAEIKSGRMYIHVSDGSLIQFGFEPKDESVLQSEIGHLTGAKIVDYKTSLRHRTFYMKYRTTAGREREMKSNVVL